MANLYITMPLSILMRFWPTAWYDYNPPLVPGGRATATRRSRLPLCRIVTIDCALGRTGEVGRSIYLKVIGLLYHTY